MIDQFQFSFRVSVSFVCVDMSWSVPALAHHIQGKIRHSCREIIHKQLLVLFRCISTTESINFYVIFYVCPGRKCSPQKVGIFADLINNVNRSDELMDYFVLKRNPVGIVVFVVVITTKEEPQFKNFCSTNFFNLSL